MNMSLVKAQIARLVNFKHNTRITDLICITNLNASSPINLRTWDRAVVERHS